MSASEILLFIRHLWLSVRFRPAELQTPKRVVLVPITHSPPTAVQGGVEIPAKVLTHLGLHSQRSWIRTHEVNVLTWPKGRLPFGLTRAKVGQWKFGELPTALEKQVFADAERQRRARKLQQIKR